MKRWPKFQREKSASTWNGVQLGLQGFLNNGSSSAVNLSQMMLVLKISWSCATLRMFRCFRNGSAVLLSRPGNKIMCHTLLPTYKICSRVSWNLHGDTPNFLSKKDWLFQELSSTMEWTFSDLRKQGVGAEVKRANYHERRGSAVEGEGDGYWCTQTTYPNCLFLCRKSVLP